MDASWQELCAVVLRAINKFKVSECRLINFGGEPKKGVPSAHGFRITLCVAQHVVGNPMNAFFLSIVMIAHVVGIQILAHRLECSQLLWCRPGATVTHSE